MKDLLLKFFVDNWPRKILSLILAIIVWFVVNQSLTKTKMLNNVGVRIVNLSEGVTIEGMRIDGLINRRVDLNVAGNRILLDKIQPGDLEVVVDGRNHTSEWIEKIDIKHLVPRNPHASSNLAGIKKVNPINLSFKPKRLIREKIPIIITEPTGDSPKGYQFVDVWPYRTQIMLRGPEDIIQRYKSQGVKLSFNLNEISRADLDDLVVSEHNGQNDVISYNIPQQWKQVYLPEISAAPIAIDNQNIKSLHFDFVRTELLPVKASIQINLYYPLRSGRTLSGGPIQVETSELVKDLNGVKAIKEDLYVKGVSDLFLQTVKNRLEITVLVGPGHQKDSLTWSVQFINPRELEDRYVAMVMGDVVENRNTVVSHRMREEYLRNRFRSYMNRFQLYRADGSKFELQIQQNDKKLSISERHADFCCTD